MGVSDEANAAAIDGICQAVRNVAFRIKVSKGFFGKHVADFGRVLSTDPSMNFSASTDGRPSNNLERVRREAGGARLTASEHAEVRRLCLSPMPKLSAATGIASEQNPADRNQL